jgi:hypothetical protein
MSELSCTATKTSRRSVVRDLLGLRGYVNGWRPERLVNREGREDRIEDSFESFALRCLKVFAASANFSDPIRELTAETAEDAEQRVLD